MYLTRAWERSDLYVRLSTDYSHDKDNSNNHTDYDYRALGTTEALDQSAQSSSNFIHAIFDTKYSFQIIPKTLKAGAGFWFVVQSNNSESDMQKNGVHDLANSYNRKSGFAFSEPRFEMEADLGNLWLLGRIKMANSYEWLDYQRGKLDTLIRHNTWFPRPHFEFKWKTSKTTELAGGMDWEHATPDMLESSAYIDDTNPLYITKGNPNLKGTSTLYSDINYRMMFAKGQQMLTFSARYNRVFDPTTGASAYNAKTGGYTTTRVNADDRQTWYASVDYDRALGKYFRLRSRLGYNATTDHGIKTMTSLDEPIEQYKRHVSNFNGNVRINFDHNGWEVSAQALWGYDGVTYSDETMSSLNLWNYRCGIEGMYKLKRWTFNLYGQLVGNTGYLSEMMNRNRFALNASVTWKCLKNKGLLTLSAKDILNQMDQVSYNISESMRNESRTEAFHRYLALTFTYNFDAKAKKDKK